MPEKWKALKKKEKAREDSYGLDSSSHTVVACMLIATGSWVGMSFGMKASIMSQTKLLYNYLKSLGLHGKSVLDIQGVLFFQDKKLSDLYLFLLLSFITHCLVKKLPGLIRTSSVSLSRAMMVSGEKRLVLLEIVVPTGADSRIKPW